MSNSRGEGFTALSARAVAAMRRGAGAMAAAPGASAPAAEPIPTRLVYAVGKIVPIPAAIPTKTATWSIGGSSRTCAGSPRATRSTSPTATPARCPTANTSAATTATSNTPTTTTASPSTSFPSRELQLRQPLDGDHPPRHLGRAGPEHPRPPFRWVGYEGDAGHGCGNHLHLSWNHARRPSSSSPNGSKRSRSARDAEHRRQAPASGAQAAKPRAPAARPAALGDPRPAASPPPGRRLSPAPGPTRGP